jgi:hypothetical protein
MFLEEQPQIGSFAAKSADNLKLVSSNILTIKENIKMTKNQLAAQVLSYRAWRAGLSFPHTLCVQNAGIRLRYRL